MSKSSLLSEQSDLAGTNVPLETLDFTLPPELEATEPPEARGLARDGVRLLVTSHSGEVIEHARFAELGRFLRAGDLVVINTSGTLPAALAVTRADGTPLELHLSTHLPGDVWSVELRTPAKPGEHGGTAPFREAVAGETLALPGGASATLLAPYTADRAALAPGTPARLWLATLRLPDSLTLLPYLTRYGFPIRYGYVPAVWPLEYYQTVYATDPGSAEMPSAGRAFTPELMARLVAEGVQIAPLLLHTGVSSMEEHEPPYEEWYRVPAPTARLVNAARAEGRRVIAVGTTVVRALETVAEPDAHGKGTVHPGEGWTRLVVTPQRGVFAVDGLLTGLHEPRASHLAMLEAIAGREHLRRAYAAALREGYLWHEFGDLHLILP
ncbi:MAG TPA: S-adenosylmethionine:tRNA ribosyltransferase-isomerase [Ktedonobacterales bacterium]|nr:S-adenosylmethionine:tRNA ribosyltransferase-isomerase [Ktedonobacterales bacterium]